MLYVGTVDVVFHFHAKEAAAARWVGNQIEAIARTDEQGIPEEAEKTESSYYYLRYSNPKRQCKRSF